MFKRILLGLMTLAALPAWGATSYFVGSAAEAAFDSAVLGGGLTASSVINFSGATGGGTSTVIKSDITFGGIGGTLLITASNQLKENYIASGARLDVTSGSTIYALGLHLQSASTPGSWCFESPGSGICDYDMVITSTAVQFFGIVSNTPISPFTIRGQTQGALVVNDFKIGTLSVTETPEPATAGLLGMALMGLGLLSRRKKQEP